MMNEELKKVRKTLIDISNTVDESSPIYNYLLNGLMFVDQATRIANDEILLNRKWLHYYADRCE